MNQEKLQILNDCIKKTANELPEGLSLPINYDKIKDNLKILDFCIDCLSDELCIKGIDTSGEINTYGLKIERVITIINARAIELREVNNHKQKGHWYSI